MSEQICPCSAACDPKNYEGRLMLWSDEAWHNWFLNDKHRSEELQQMTRTRWKTHYQSHSTTYNECDRFSTRRKTINIDDVTCKDCLRRMKKNE